MNLIRRYRRPIQLVLMLFALGAMSYGYLKRVGVDAFAGLRPDSSTEAR